MANPDDITLTEGSDTFAFSLQGRFKTIYALGGNDRITLRAPANVEGGAGDDVLINATDNQGAGIGYWNSPGPVTIDLEAGYALDGYGTRDSIQGFRQVFTPGRSGDKVLGSSSNDWVMLNGFAWYNSPTPGSAYIDLRGGVDQVAFWELNPGDFTIKVSSDGRRVDISYGNYSATLLNVESLSFHKPNLSNPPTFQVTDLIDFSEVGEQTLLASGQRGWSGGTISYSFMSATPSYGGAEGGSGFAVPNATYQGAVRSILGQLSSQIGVNFTEVTDSASAYGQLRFGTNQQATTKGYSFIPGAVSTERAGDVWLDVETLSSLQPGQEGWQVLLHEIGHALGLSHPINEGTNTQATVLLNQWNHNGYTVMSPNQTSSGLWQSWFGPLDIQALAHLYGRRASDDNTGDNVYRMSDSRGFSLSSLRDSNGSDTLDASGLSVGAYINLAPGSFNSLGYTLSGTASVDNLYIEPGTLIEHAVGTPFDDVLLGNSADNLFWPGKGNDWIDGKGGLNIALYDVRRSTQTIEQLDDGSGAWVVQDAAGADGSDTLLNVSRVHFSDVRVALDVTGRAADAARITATVFGPNALKQPAITGSVLKQLDAGAPALDAYASALASPRFAQLAGGTDDMSFVKQMFRNLLGIEATNDMARPFVQQFLASGAYTQPTFAQAVSSLAPVDMVGLAKSGLDFVY